MAANPSPEPLQLVRKTVWDEVPFIISRMPREFGASPAPIEDEIGAWITSQLDVIMEEFLVQDSERERELWARRAEVDLPPSLWARFDELIIRQTVTLGYWMEHSAVVQNRIRTWEVTPNGDELYKRYNDARDQNMRILHRLEPPPIDPQFKRFKAETISELQIVLHDLRGHFAESRQSVALADLLDRFRQKVTQSGCTYLQGNQLSWEAFFTARLLSIKNLLTTGTRTKPAGLFDEWAEWATGRACEALRQMISKQKA
jgi:hypothetical protein